MSEREEEGGVPVSRYCGEGTVIHHKSKNGVLVWVKIRSPEYYKDSVVQPKKKQKQEVDWDAINRVNKVFRRT